MICCRYQLNSINDFIANLPLISCSLKHSMPFGVRGEKIELKLDVYEEESGKVGEEPNLVCSQDLSD